MPFFNTGCMRSHRSISSFYEYILFSSRFLQIITDEGIPVSWLWSWAWSKSLPATPRTSHMTHPPSVLLSRFTPHLPICLYLPFLSTSLHTLPPSRNAHFALKSTTMQRLSVKQTKKKQREKNWQNRRDFLLMFQFCFYLHLFVRVFVE